MAKKSKKVIDLGLLEDLLVKKADAQERLENVFGMFFRTSEGSYFIFGGPVKPELVINDNFTILCVGASQIEVVQARDMVTYIGSMTAEAFSTEDFHSTVALDFITNALKDGLEEMKLPQALAAEFIIYDQVSDKLMTIKYDGDFAIYDLGEDTEDTKIVGFYNKKSDAFTKCVRKKFSRGIGSRKDLERFDDMVGKLKLGPTTVYVANKKTNEKSD